MRRGIVAACAGVVLVLAAPMHAQQVLCDRDLPEVRKLDFTGNERFRDDQLALRIVTSPSGVARRLLRVFGQKLCFDSTVVQADASRLLLFYRAQGFRGTTARHEVTAMGPKAVHVRFVIREGRELLVDSLAVNGLDDVPVRDRVMRNLPLKTGDRMDRARLDAMRDTITHRLRDNGYPTAEVFQNIDTDTATLRAIVWYEASPGPRMRIGSIPIEVQRGRGEGEKTGVHPGRVRSTLGISPGDLFSERELEGVKRGLYLTEAFQHVDVSVDTASLSDAADSLVNVNVTLREGDLHGARASVGWGNYDCLRAQVNASTVNFLGGLRRVDATARISRIGAGEPFDAFRSLCPGRVRDDPLSRELNYYGGATYSQPPLFGRRVFPTFTLFSERRSEFLTYLKDTRIGAQAALRTGARIPLSFSYQLEYGSTRAERAYFCSVFNVCDPETFTQLSDVARRTAVLGFSAVRSTANNLADPSSGSVVQMEFRHASPGVGSDPFVEFTRGSVDAAWYRALPGNGRVVLRVRAGSVFTEQRLAGGQRFIPPQERLYAGGPNSVRGVGPNQLGALVYEVENGAFNVVTVGGDTYYQVDSAAQRITPDRPTGGDNVVVLNAELRFRSPLYPELVQLAAFVDAGQVWNQRATSIRAPLRQLKTTPGIGVRIFSPIGPLRMDVALAPQKLPDGPVYFIDRRAQIDRANQRVANPNFGQVYCVSPGNLLKVTDVGGGAQRQEAGTCPSAFRPPPRTGLFRWVTFNFSIGQAF